MFRNFIPRAYFWRVWSVSPLIIGIFTALTLYSCYDTSSTALSRFNIHTWSIMRYSPVGEFALLHMMLISNVVVVMLGTVVYISDIYRGYNSVASHPGSKSILTA